MLTCQELTEVITDYVEGRMSFWQRAQLQLHLGMCSGCRAYLRQMRLTIQTVGALPKEPIPEDVERALLERLESMGGRSRGD